jgi:formate dehydrogenase major subunit
MRHVRFSAGTRPRDAIGCTIRFLPQADYDPGLLEKGHGRRCLGQGIPPSARQELWQTPLSKKSGLTVVEIINAANAGEIRGMYIQGENPAMSDPDLDHARAGIAKLEHLVVQDIFLSETAMMADVVLPSSAWPEKSGTVTNTNRQVQMGRKALDLPGDTRDALWIIVEMAKGLGLNWQYTHPAEVFAEMKLAMPSLENITWERLEQESSIIYPCPEPDHPGEAIVISDGFPTCLAEKSQQQTST